MGVTQPNAGPRSDSASLRPVEALRQSYKTLANDPLVRNNSIAFPAADALKRDKSFSAAGTSFCATPSLAFVPSASSGPGPFQMVPSEPASSHLLNPPPAPPGNFCFIETPGPASTHLLLQSSEAADVRQSAFVDSNAWLSSQPSAQAQPVAPRLVPSNLNQARSNTFKTSKLMQHPSKKYLPPQASDQPLQFLQVLLDRISRLDSDRFFEYPVTEDQAPGYHTIIKKPMCFQKMRDRLNERAYKTWRSFVDDFELICTNAMQYNQKRSRIHRAALTMLRQGKKILVESELQGRRAVAVLHPGGVAAAAADEQKEAHQTAQKAVANALAKTASRVLDEPYRTQSVAETRTTSETEDVAFGYATSDEEQYSAFSSTDLSEDEQPFDTYRTRTLEEVKQPVCFQPFEVQQFTREISKQVSKATTSSDVKSAKPTDAAWKSEAAQVEFRCRWLELRLRDLAEEANLYTQRLNSVASCSSKQVQDAGARNEDVGANQLSVRKMKHRQSHSQVPEFARFENVPFFADQAGVRRLNQAGGDDTKKSVAEPSYDVRAEEKYYPARVYATVELVERQLTALRKHLQQIPHLQPVAPVTKGTTRASGRGGRGGGRGLRKAVSQGRGGSNAKAVHRSESLASIGKRKRTEYDLHDVVAPVKILAPKGDKVQAASITTPPFRLIDEDELKRREVAIAALAWNIKLPGGKGALPSEVAALVEDEGSSSEDTSDEAYMRRHFSREREEKDLYASAAGGANKKNNNASKNPRASQSAPLPPPKGPLVAASPALPEMPSQAQMLDPLDSAMPTPFSAANVAAAPDAQAGLPTITVRGRTGRGRNAEGRGLGGRTRGRPPGISATGARSGRGGRLVRAGRGAAATGRPPLGGRSRGSKTVPEQFTTPAPAAADEQFTTPAPPAADVPPAPAAAADIPLPAMQAVVSESVAAALAAAIPQQPVVQPSVLPPPDVPPSTAPPSAPLL